MASVKTDLIPKKSEDTLLTEKRFYHYTSEIAFDQSEIGFVMVDFWNTGFGPQPLSHLGWEAELNAGKSF